MADTQSRQDCKRRDLGLDLKELSDRGVSLVARGRTQYFGLNLKNGHLFVNERMDREQICGHIAKCVLNVEVLAENPVKLYRGEVEIKDINDNSPSFPENESVLEISEYTVRGTRFPLEKAHDPDVGLNSLQNYKCSQDSYFILNVETGDDGVKYPELILETSLDREHQAVHNLILTATDGGDPVKSGSSVIRIVVLDGNDNAPEFTQSVYKVSVKEDIPVDSVVLRVTASDRDEGINAQIKYSFLKISERFDKKFKLDSETGDIQVTAKLDFEEFAFYELDIQARDEGGLSAHSKVLIEIADVNNHIPEITITSSFSPIAEDSLIGAVIAILNVHDRDSGENGEVTCSIIPESLPFKLERSFDNFYTVVTDRALDREQVSEYNITVIATDRGIPPLSSNKTFFVEVLDKNDNRPVFDQKHYTVYIPENSTPGVSVFHMKANDVDWKENVRVTYSIIEGDRSEVPLSSYISINSETGTLYALRSFDYEQFREIWFQVQAQDGGSPPLSSNVSVTLFILDQNDNSPHILHPSFPTDGSTGVELAPRSSEPGYLVTKVVAVDADSGQNAWLSYQLLKATEPGLFSVGLHSELLLEKPLDREKRRYHHLVLTAVDGGDPVRTGTAQVRVNVTDANDNPPVFTEEIYKVSLRENLPKGSLVLQVKATDTDEGLNAEIMYSFSNIPDNARKLFNLDPRTGEITVTGPLDFEEVKFYQANVEAKDGGGLTAHSKVQIQILDENDNAPVIAFTIISNPVPEDSAPGTVLFYLVLALALISFLFLLTIVAVLMMKFRRSMNPTVLRCFSPSLYSKSSARCPPNYGDGILPYSYNRCLAINSGKNYLKFLKPKDQTVIAQNIISNDNSGILFLSNDCSEPKSEISVPDKVSFALDACLLFGV
uniref:Cadherin domain-containing protein n=1 Tax=Gopherus evgoodei TaxID=1825980 RepID=A0A8C4YH85_9SAUR